MSDTISLKEFRRQLDSASLDMHAETLERSVGRLLASAKAKAEGIGKTLEAKNVSVSTVAAKEFDRMKGFLTTLYDGTSAEHSFIDSGGNLIDCIPWDQQPTVKAAKRAGHEPRRQSPPAPVLDHPEEFGLDAMPAGPKAFGIVAPLRQGLVDLYGNKIATPAGMAPFRRISLARLAHLGSLDRFFTKKAAPPVQDPRPDFKRLATAPVAGAGGQTLPAAEGTPDPFVHRYGASNFGPFQQTAVFSGFSSFLNVWKPDPRPGGMSLSQQWILSNGGPYGLQTIESGWQVAPGNRQNTWDPVLFIYFNPDNYGQAGKAGYTFGQSGEGFIAADGAHWAAGSSVSMVSTRGGAQFGFVMVWTRDNEGNWNLHMGSSASDLTYVGYFPGVYYSPGLSSGADYVQFGGEVASADTRATGPMGSGVAAADASLTNYGNVAFQYQLKYVPTNGSGQFVDVDVDVLTRSQGHEPDDASYYSITHGKAPAWGSYIFFGGAGAP